MKLLFFGRLGEAAGTRERIVDLPEGIVDAGALRAWLGRDDPLLGQGLLDPSIRLVRNGAVASGNARVADGDEIAFLPPVSGG